MRRTVLIATAAIAALAAVPVAGALTLQSPAPVKVHVSPATGGPRTAFAVSWRNPVQIGTVGSLQRSETVAIAGPKGRGCVTAGQVAVPATVAPRQLIRLSLAPARMSTTKARQWCTGTFHGIVVQSQRFACSPPTDLCPELAIRPQTIARFTFKVTRRA
jgi:hypothetical protein